MNNLELWKKVEQPPEWALKEITGGRLKGKTDINPQWRYKALTENFGICGIGWKYEIVRLWLENTGNTVDDIFAFSEIKLYIKVNENWSDPIPGIGGALIVESESKGLHANDEAYKMATTDALSVACKMLGIAANIYSGSKYDNIKESKLSVKSKEESLKFFEQFPEHVKLFFKDTTDKDKFIFCASKGWIMAEIDAEVSRIQSEAA
jgi:hypothetical protein